MNITTPDASTDPQLSREDALAVLNTPDESLEELVSFAETYRRKYKGNHVSIHILTNARSGSCSPGLCLLRPVLPLQSGHQQIQMGRG